MSRNTANIGSLPNELLWEIFFHHSRSSRDAQTLSSVNRRWRNVAIACAPLWCQVAVNITKEHPPLPLLNIWIKRTAGSPLDIEIFEEYRFDFTPISTLYGSQEEDYFGYVANILVRFAYKWRSLSLNISNWDSLHSVIFLMVAELWEATQLERIGVNVRGKETQLMKAFAALPSVKYLTWKSHGPSRRVIPLFPWGQLVHLSLEWLVAWACVFDAGSKCTAAVSMVLAMRDPSRQKEVPGYDSDDDFDVFDMVRPMKKLSLSHLRTLVLTLADSTFLDLLQLVNCPNLTVLSIQVEDMSLEHSDDHLDYLFPFLTDSTHAIQVLRIKDLCFSANDLITFFLACRAASIPAVELLVCEEMWEEDVDLVGIKDALVEDGAPAELLRFIGGQEECVVSSGWVDTVRINEFLEEVTHIPNFDWCGVRPKFELASNCPTLAP